MADTDKTETVTPAKDETLAADPNLTNQEKPRTPAELQAELDSAQKRIKELNAESAKHRKQAEALAKADEERKTNELSETEKLKAKADKAEADKVEAINKANARLIRASVLVKATGRFIDPTDVVTALASTLELDDETGEVKGLDEALDALAKAKPHWLGKQAPPKLKGTNPSDGSGGETEAQQRARVYGGGGQIFDKASAADAGGGVVFLGKQD